LEPKQEVHVRLPLAPILALTLFSAAALAAAPAAAPASGAASGAAAQAVAEMANYLDKAQDAADNNHLAEAIRSYVTVLALAEESPSPEAKAKADSASTQLARIGTRLTLEPSSEWIDPKGTQIAGSSRTLGKEGGLPPAVYLFDSFGTGKSPVADAPIYFQFTKNSGSLVAFVTTDAYGKANTTVAKLDEPGSDAVIRAFPVFKARGKSYAFQSVFRDFAYLPPANVVTVLALESSELGASDNPRTVDPVATALKMTGLQVLPYNAKLNAASFQKAYGGDVKALASLGVTASSPYAAFVVLDIAAARQMELNGKKYNIFTAAVTLNFRLVRADGTVVYSLPLDGIKGQGGTKEAAIADAYRRAGDAIGPELQKRAQAIQDALQKE
jgi:hypothetical protein